MQSALEPTRFGSAVEEPLILDRYRPLATLGAGGHGSVVLAFDTKMARRVAVKVLPLPHGRTGLPLRTGLAEARTAALLNHPNIVTVHEWDTGDAHAYIVMEDLDGASLAEVLDDLQGPLAPQEVAAVLEAVASAMSYAHANGVLHLDLKPANVLVTRKGHIKVADFGVAALTDATGRASGTSGTIGYMPPEQIRRETLDERTDVWALASLIYELLTDANPFDADTAEGSLFKIEVADVPAASEFEPSIRPAVDTVLAAALDPDPDARYESVRDFADALLPYLGDPATGHASLQQLVEALVADEEISDAEESGRLGLWDRLAPYAGATRRASYGVVCAWLGGSGLAAGGLGATPALAGAALIGLAGVLAPGLGLGLGLAAFAYGALVSFGIAGGLPFLLLAASFWWLRGRRGLGDGLAPALAPLLGIVRAAPAVPLVLGFAFEPLPAAVAAAFSALAARAAATLTGAAELSTATGARFALAPLETVTAPAEFAARMLTLNVGAIAALWAAAAAVTSLACRRGTRLAGLAGVLLGTAILAVGHTALASASAGTTPADLLPDLIVGAAVACLVVALGAPMRPDARE